MPFKKNCIKCGKKFKPSSSGNKICKNCKPKSFLDNWLEKENDKKTNK